jgi:hypothetical protein
MEYRYAIFSNDDNSEVPETQQFTMQGPIEALSIARHIRSQRYDDGGFVAPVAAAERDAFPYRNKIGPLRADNSNHWGYRFRLPETEKIISIWIKKLAVGPGNATLRQELESGEMVPHVQRCECDYIVCSSVQANLDRAYGRRYDEDRKDFVFDGELDTVAGGDEEVVVRDEEDLVAGEGEEIVADEGEEVNVPNGEEVVRQAPEGSGPNNDLPMDQ